MRSPCYHLGGPVLNSILYVWVALVLVASELDTVLEVQLQQSWWNQKDNLSWLTGDTFPNAAKKASSFLTKN